MISSGCKTGGSRPLNVTLEHPEQICNRALKVRPDKARLGRIEPEPKSLSPLTA